MKSSGKNFFEIQKKKIRFFSFIPFFLFVSWTSACSGGFVDKFHSSAADLPDLAAPGGASELTPRPEGSIDAPPPAPPPPFTTGSAPPTLMNISVNLQQINPAAAALIEGVLTPDASNNPTVAGNSAVQGIGSVSISDEARRNIETQAEAEGPVVDEGLEELEF